MKVKDFEQKIEESKKILDKLMDPAITLENSMKFYKEGIKELKEASMMLEKAKIEFEELSKISENES